MTSVYGILVIIGIIGLVVLWCVWSLKTEQKRLEKEKAQGIWYDERQIAARGKVYRIVAGVGGIYYLIVYLCLKIWQFQGCVPKVEPALLLVGGVYLMLISCEVCCLLTDSVLPLGKFSLSKGFYVAECVIGLFFLIMFVFLSNAPLTGEGSSRWEIIFLQFYFLTSGAVHLIAISRNKREAE